MLAKNYLIYYIYNDGRQTGEGNVTYDCAIFRLADVYQYIIDKLPVSNGDYLPKRYSIVIRFMIEL